MSKSLLILRHAEAAQSFNGDDHARVLSGRGQSQAQAVGRWMYQEELWPDMVLVSDAMRTRQTCVWLGQQLGDKGATALHDGRLYQGSGRSLCSVINETPESVQRLLVIAHMPGVQDVAMSLASVSSDEEAVLQMAENWPPAGCASLSVPGEWALLDGRDAELNMFHVPQV